MLGLRLVDGTLINDGNGLDVALVMGTAVLLVAGSGNPPGLKVVLYLVNAEPGS